MSKSFEDKLKDRLGDYQVPPPADAKAAILGKPPVVNSYAHIYHYIGALLLLISLFRVGYRSQASDDLLLSQSQAEENQFNNAPGTLERDLSEDEIVYDPEGNTKLTSTLAKSTEPIVLNAEPAKEGMVLVDKSNESASAEEIVTFSTHDLESLSDQMSMKIGKRRFLGNKYAIYDQVVPKTERAFKPYFESGAFFLYNRLKPNLDDNIFLSDYNAPFGLSVSRIGLAVNLGVQVEVSKRITLKLGAVYNNYNQSFSFGIRNTQPDSVAVVADSDFFEPVFNSERIDINKRVSTLGGRVQAVWAVPSRFNAILASFEYHHMLGSGAQFTYEGVTHSLSQKNQYLFEIGLQKLLYESRRARLSLIPSLRYAVNKFGSTQALSVKPFSVGVSVSYGLK